MTGSQRRRRKSEGESRRKSEGESRRKSEGESRKRAQEAAAGGHHQWRTGHLAHPATDPTD